MERKDNHRATSTHGQRQKSTFRLFGYEIVSVDTEKGELTFTHPGLCIEDFDKDDQPKIWTMMSWVVYGRSFTRRQIVDAEKGETFLNLNQIIRDRLRFIRAAEFEFTKAAYDINISKRPLFMTEKGEYLGRSSWSTTITVTNSSGDLLLTNTNQVTGVDPNTRKSKPLPEIYKEKYGRFYKGKQLIFHQIPRPATTGCYRARVNWSDLDGNNHATWHTYIMMAINAASKCAKEGTLRHFRENKLNGLNKLQLQFYGESLEGDELEVFIWEGKETHVMISDVCKNGKTIFQGLFHFFKD